MNIKKIIAALCIITHLSNINALTQTEAHIEKYIKHIEFEPANKIQRLVHFFDYITGNTIETKEEWQKILLNIMKKRAIVPIKSRKQILSNFEKLITREKKYQDDYFVFYHAQKNELSLIPSILTEIYRVNGDTRSDFIYLRDPKTLTLNKIAPQLKMDFYLSPYLSITDHTPLYSKHMLSVNLSLMGNFDLWSLGECTLCYFLRSISLNDAIKPLLEPILQTYNIDNKYIQKLKKCHSMYGKSRFGELYQIFIPKKYINKFVYISHALGQPILIDQKTSNILEEYTNKYNAFTRVEQDTMQARIVFSKDFFAPETGIKIFSYNALSNEKQSHYHNEIKKIIHEALA